MKIILSMSFLQTFNSSLFANIKHWNQFHSCNWIDCSLLLAVDLNFLINKASQTLLLKWSNNYLQLINIQCHQYSVHQYSVHIISINIQCHQTWLLCSFFTLNIIYFAQKHPIKVQFFEFFECSGENLSNFSCQFWTDK